MSIRKGRILVVVLGTMVLTGCQAIRRITSAPQPAGPGPLTSLDGVAEAMRDTIAERLASIELERATLLARFRAQSPEITSLDRTRLVLCRDLEELQRTISVEAFTTTRVLRAVEERLAGLAVDRTVMLIRRSPGSPEVRAIDRTIEELQRRRSSLRAPRNGGELRACPTGGAP